MNLTRQLCSVVPTQSWECHGDGICPFSQPRDSIFVHINMLRFEVDNKPQDLRSLTASACFNAALGNNAGKVSYHKECRW